jgi:hypothetical protein
MAWKEPDIIDWKKSAGCWVFPVLLIGGYLLFRLFV